MTHAVFEPIALRGVEIRNRLWIAPMCQFMVEAEDGIPTDWHLMHLGAFAQGGAGVVTVEATSVLPDGRSSPNDLGLWNDTQRDAFRRIVELIQREGAKASIQLGHAGRKASAWRAWAHRDGNVPPDQGGWVARGPSAIPFPGRAVPTELGRDEIEDIVSAFAVSARRAIDVGFDLVELHGAHGYLFHAFLSPRSNVRTDHYGGALANRARLLLEAVDAVRREIGEAVPLVVRLSATDWIEGGWGLDETVEVAGWLREHGVDLVSVSSGGNEPSASIPVGPAYQLALASAVRERAHVPVATAGLLSEPFQVEQIVALGQADVVLIGRQALRDAKFPIRVAAALRYDLPYRPIQYERAFS